MTAATSGDATAAHMLDLEPTLRSTFEGADHVDVVTARGTVSLRAFLAGMVSYYPWWLGVLFTLRWAFVRLLGLSQRGLLRPPSYTPAAVPFEPGGRLGLFTVDRAEPNRYWTGRITEPHLTATIAVVAESEPGGQRFYVGTVVHYTDWRGRFYFAVVRPFHYLVVRRMAAAGAVSTD